MIEVFLTLHDGHVSFSFGDLTGSFPCDTTLSNSTAALAKAFQICIEAIIEPHDTIVVHHEDLRTSEEEEDDSRSSYSSSDHLNWVARTNQAQGH